jgi:hypothetical protein
MRLHADERVIWFTIAGEGTPQQPLEATGNNASESSTTYSSGGQPDITPTTSCLLKTIWVY